MDNISTIGPDEGTSFRAGGEEVMQVDAVGSPTELAEGSELEAEGSPSGAPAVKMEKRKRREGERKGRARTVPDETDDELDSPSKRPLRSSEAPLTAKEIREMLCGHMNEMKDAWGSVQGRIEKIETEQAKTTFDVSNLQSRTRVLEKDATVHRQKLEANTVNLENLATEVHDMKVKLDNLQVREGPPGAPPQAARPPAPDPWMDYLRARGDPHKAPRGEVQSGVHEQDKGDFLSDEEKRTLVVGGWLQDTKRGVIEEESAFIFQLEAVKPLLDADKLAIYGPRRSVGMLKFTQRDGEAPNDVRERMWKVLRAVSATKTTLPSTRVGGDSKVLWLSFVKTKNARARSAHVSLIRRVAIDLAKDSCTHPHGVGGVSGNTDPLSYDCDWNLGTIWCGVEKLGSASHRQPKEGEIITFGAGWASLSAIARVAGCSTDEARSAFDRENNL